MGRLGSRTALCSLLLLALAGGSRAGAQQPGADATAEATAEAEYGATATVDEDGPSVEDSLGRSVVTRRELDRRQPTSAPAALTYEPGVYIQKTAHGQASPYVRGMTGQQVVHLFDGVRMNNGVYRQGPNQHFFAIDAQTLSRLEVLRGSASVRHGSDALGGAIMAFPRQAYVDVEQEGLSLRPRVSGRFASADLSIGGRGELEAQLGPRTGVLVGGGYRDVDQLQSGGVVDGVDGVQPLVPRFEDDGRTQHGTGFREATFDGHVTHRLVGALRLVGAIYGYRQFDAPRTDQCPAPYAPVSECLWIDEQFRTLGYLSLRGDAGAMRDVELTASVQQHHERRRRDRPLSFDEQVWRNDVLTLGAAFGAATRDFRLGEAASFKLRYGADAYRDSVGSAGFQTATNLGVTQPHERPQYIDGSVYLSTGAFAELELSPLGWLTVRGGGRGAAVGARAAADRGSDTSGVHREWTAVVGRAGVDVRPLDGLQLSLNADQGFRAPNLDDLTSRQQVGSSFQFENADLVPERTTTYELGVIAGPEWLQADAWVFATLLDDAMVRAVRDASDCPADSLECPNAWSRIQLINADDHATILGTEGAVRARLPARIGLRATYAYAWGEAPDVRSQETRGQRVPMSRIPPLNGTVELEYSHLATSLDFGAALRWALAQRRLAPNDVVDERIPAGGTPGYAAFDLRAGFRHGDWLQLRLVLENILDTAYRVHGSSVNAAGRGVVLSATVAG